MADLEETLGQVAMQADHSLFLVEISLLTIKREMDDKDAKKAYQCITDKVKKAEQRLKKQHKDRTPSKHNLPERLSTGFVVSNSGGKLKILTCAHSMDEVFTAGMHHILTLEELSSIFQYDVYCFHHATEVHAEVSNIMISERERTLTQAKLVAFDSELDLLLIEVDGTINCQKEHPAINLALTNPLELQKVVMTGWPPQRSGDYLTGHVSHCDWTYDAITGLNIKGYTMRLLEVQCLVGSDGFSGSPVLNYKGECVGVYHGVFNTMMGYAVSLQDVKAFLQQNLTPNMEEEAEGDDEDEETEGDEEEEEAEGDDEDEETDGDELGTQFLGDKLFDVALDPSEYPSQAEILASLGGQPSASTAPTSCPGSSMAASPPPPTKAPKKNLVTYFKKRLSKK